MIHGKQPPESNLELLVVELREDFFGSRELL